MRLWSVHPRQLDRAALIAGWREGLLAQKVLAGLTKGYQHHPQLVRFRATTDPDVAIATWLHGLADEATARGYRFDRTRVTREPDEDLRIMLNSGQLDFEWEHLGRKVQERNPDHWQLIRTQQPQAHPMFIVVPGEIEQWERP